MSHPHFVFIFVMLKKKLLKNIYVNQKQKTIFQILVTCLRFALMHFTNVALFKFKKFDLLTEPYVSASILSIHYKK